MTAGFKIEELAGVVPALISPLRRDGRVDEAAVARLVDHVIDGGVSGLLPLGSTGETASLDETARRTILLRTYISRLRKKLNELGADAEVVNKSRKGYALIFRPHKN